MDGQGFGKLRITLVATIAGAVATPLLAPEAYAAPHVPVAVLNSAKTVQWLVESRPIDPFRGSGFALGELNFGHSIPGSGFGPSQDGLDGAYLIRGSEGCCFVAPSGVVSVTGNTVSATGDFGQLGTEVRYTFFEPSVARMLASFTNNSANEQSFTVDFASNLGSDALTAIEATSSGDRKLTTKDTWFVTGAGRPPAADQPVNAFGRGNRHVRGRDVVVAPGKPPVLTRDDYIEEHTFTLAPGAIIRFMYFTAIGRTKHDAVALAKTFASVKQLNLHNYMQGITPEEAVQIENWRGFHL